MIPMKSLPAIEAAARWLREGKTPPRHEADRIVKALDAMALALTLGECPERKAAQFADVLTERVEAA